MHGNRDFLLGEKFAEKCGAKLIPDPLILDGKGKKIMLSHGDIFCTDDMEYQDFKEKVRNEKWKIEFLSKNLRDREEIAKNLRKESAVKNAKKQDYLMDVNKSEVEKIAQENEIEILIHGHVHRPKIHNEVFGQRIVLGDWDKKYWFISLIGEQVRLHSCEIK
jgi:UDP-2,3-diacylglucosamine hydrolase